MNVGIGNNLISLLNKSHFGVLERFESSRYHTLPSHKSNGGDRRISHCSLGRWDDTDTFTSLICDMPY